MEITDEDVAVAKDQLINALINENLKLGAQLAGFRREADKAERPYNHTENGEVFVEEEK
jgi:hypothetical protein